jgi:hypothetical protein
VEREAGSYFSYFSWAADDKGSVCRVVGIDVPAPLLWILQPDVGVYWERFLSVVQEGITLRKDITRKVLGIKSDAS